MHDNKVKVKVEWQGTKAHNLPAGLKYVTVAKFDNDLEQEAWSVVLEFDQAPAFQGNPSNGYAKFLVPQGPINKLVSGVKFELHEGYNLTAKVTVE